MLNDADAIRPAYLDGGRGGTGAKPLAITTALLAAIMVFNPIAPTSMPRARATAPSLRDMECLREREYERRHSILSQDSVK